MKVELIPNRGPAYMGAEIDDGLAWADKADIASAFVTLTALKRVEMSLQAAHNKHLRIRLLVGLYQRFTAPQVLKYAAGLARKYPGQFYLRVATNSRFHWKLYNFAKGKQRRIYVGSANLTSDGLSAAGELTLKVRAESSNSIVRVVEKEFNEAWEDDAFVPSNELVAQYGKAKRPPKAVLKPTHDDQLKHLLKKAEREARPNNDSAAVTPKPRLVLIDEDVQDRTNEIVAEETDWSRNGWNYICYPYKHSRDVIERTGIFILLDWPDQIDATLEFRRVEQVLDLETPDGRYLLAHSKVRGGWQITYGEIRADLLRWGLCQSDLKKKGTPPCLTQQQLKTLCRKMHVQIGA